MKTQSHVSVLLASMSALTILLGAVTADAQPQDRREERREARRGAEPVTRSDQVITDRGAFSRRIETDINAEGDRAHRSRTMTGPEGQTAGVLGAFRHTETGTVTSQTFTDRDGDTAGRSLARSIGEGSASRQREAYTRSGETAYGSDTVTRTDTGARRTRQFETSTGRGGAVDSEVARTDDGGSFNRTVTDADGNVVATRETTLTNDGDSLNKTTTVTSPDRDD